VSGKSIDFVNDIYRKSPPEVSGVSLWIKEKKEIPYKEAKINDIGAHVLLYTHSSKASDADTRFGSLNYLNFNGHNVPGTCAGTLNTRDRFFIGIELTPPLLPFEAKTEDLDTHA
jgi:hypothetical protein